MVADRQPPTLGGGNSLAGASGGNFTQYLCNGTDALGHCMNALYEAMDMCLDMCVDMCGDMCVDMCGDMCAHMCIGMRAGPNVRRATILRALASGHWPATLSARTAVCAADM